MKLASLVTGLISALPFALTAALTNLGGVDPSVIRSGLNTLAQEANDPATFTQGVIQYGLELNSDLNWVVCHPQHDYYFAGVKGPDWQQFSVDFQTSGNDTSIEYVRVCHQSGQVLIDGLAMTFRFKVYAVTGKGQFWLIGDEDPGLAGVRTVP